MAYVPACLLKSDGDFSGGEACSVLGPGGDDGYEMHIGGSNMCCELFRCFLFSCVSLFNFLNLPEYSD
jgi:hypothetical protein